ncbi:MAG: putative hydroxymethylpyrimidine transporter CytX [Lachnospiraceae bacterium]
MTEKKTGLFENGLIWFGAGVSIAEILTGTYFAPLGFAKGIAAILLGHLIGAIAFFLAGYQSAKVGKSAMETVKMTYGAQGGKFFAAMNVIQLLGWTAIMIYDGSLSAEAAIPAGRWVWCIVIGGLILLWILIGITNLGKVNLAAMTLLFVLTLLLCRIIFFSGNTAVSTAGEEVMSFGAAVELAVSMPLSWLPCIGDYTREAEKPLAATLVSTIVYSLVSIWMFVIGMGASLYTGNSDIAGIMTAAGLGIAGLLVIVFSTVTTTFLDAESAGISAESLTGRFTGKQMAAAAAILGTILSLLFVMDDITNFLYFIGSVFAPMAAVMIVNFFVLHRDSEEQAWDVPNLIVWLAGFVLYRILMRIDIPVGNTLPDMLATGVIAFIAGKVLHRSKQS